MQVNPKDVITKEVKSKGRITLGAEYEGKTVELAILEVRD